MLQEDYELAHIAFGRAQSTDPEYAHAWLGEGIIALTVGDAREALSHFTHAVDIADASSLPVKNSYIAAEFDNIVSARLGQSEMAKLIQPIFVLQQLGAQAAIPSVYRHLIALLQERIGDFKAASGNLVSVCTFSEARFEKSESAADLAQFVLAKSDLARVQLAANSYQSAAETAGTVLDLSADADSLALTAEQVGKLRLSAHLTAGVALYFLHQMDEGIEMFRGALEESNETPDIVCALSLLLWAKGGMEEKSVAQEQLYNCVEQHPRHFRATCLLGAMSALQEDEAALEAVLADLHTMRTETKIESTKRKQIEDLLSLLVRLSFKKNETGPDEIAGLATSIILAPWDANGWNNLGEGSDEPYPAEMAMKTASRLGPPGGSISAEELAAAFAKTETVRNAQRSMFLCPWQGVGRQTFEACLA